METRRWVQIYLTVVGQMTGSKELIRMSRNMEVNSMCEALEKLKEEGEQKGKKRARSSHSYNAAE